MNRKQCTILQLVVFWSVVLGVPGVWLWRANRQERRNRQLIEAIKREDTSAAQLALKQGADANAPDEPVVPAWQRIWDVVRGRRAGPSTAPTALLLSLGSSEFSDGTFTERKESPELVSALLAHGAHINEIDQYGRSPLLYAIVGQQKRTSRLLIELGADVNFLPFNNNLVAIEIMSCRDTDLTELMLQHGASANLRGGLGVTTRWLSPLEAAVVLNKPAIVRLLLRYHADPNTGIIADKSLLQYAKWEHMPEIAKLLREASARR